MGIELGVIVGLWVLSGVAFWAAFVTLGFRFRAVDEADDASAAAVDESGSSRTPPRAAPEHVFARSRR